MKRVIYIHSFLKAGDWSIVQYPVTFGGLRKPEGKVYPKKRWMEQVAPAFIFGCWVT